MGTLGRSTIREDLSGFDSDPRFKVGDRVKTDTGVVCEVEAVVMQFTYTIRSEASGLQISWPEAALTKYPKYTEKEAWIKASGIIGREVALSMVDKGFVSDLDRRVISGHATDILGQAVIIGSEDRQEVDDMISLAILDTINYKDKTR